MLSLVLSAACGDSGTGGNGGSGGSGNGGASTNAGGDPCEELAAASEAKCNECPGLCEGSAGGAGEGGSGGAAECDPVQAACLIPCLDTTCDALAGTPGPEYDALVDCIFSCT